MREYALKFTTRMAKDFRRMQKQGRDMDKLASVLGLLREGKTLPEACHDHALSGRWRGARDCHIEDDWILIYARDDDNLVLLALATGSHTGVFG